MIVAELGIEIPKGDPGGMEAGAGALGAAMGSLERAYGALQSSGSIAGWRGMAALVYRDAATMHAASAGHAHDAMSRAKHALVRAARVLETQRRLAKKALNRAREADRRAQAARARVGAAIEAAGAARDRIAQLDAQAAMMTQEMPWHAGEREAASSALQSAEWDRRRAQEDLTQAQTEIKEAQEQGREANLRWESEGDRTGQELAGLAGAAYSVAPALGFGLPRPALGGGGGSLGFLPFPALPGTPRRRSPKEMAERDRPEEDGVLDRFPKPPLPDVPALGDIWKEAKRRAGWIGFGTCYIPKAWKDERNDIADEIHDLAECSPIGSVINDNGDETDKGSSGSW